MHLVPSDTYISQCTIKEVLKSVTNHKSLHASPDSLLIFGNGDGGSGPLPNMMECPRRIRGASADWTIHQICTKRLRKGQILGKISQPELVNCTWSFTTELSLPSSTIGKRNFCFTTWNYSPQLRASIQIQVSTKQNQQTMEKCASESIS